MKVIMYMAVSSNGMIAKRDDDTSWISKEEWASYSLAVRTAGNLIVGRRTYNLLTKQPEFSEFKDVKLIAISKDKFKTIAHNHFIAHSPKEALNLIKESEKVIVAGGATLNSSFLEENLIDELYLDIEPIILSQGIPIFKESNFERKLKLIGQKMITPHEIQLHYQVLK